MNGDERNFFFYKDVLSEEEFSHLLADPTFVDYFNTFLSLPVFGKRLVYVSDEDNFKIDPPVKRTSYYVIECKVKTWIRTLRVPMFWKTDLYLDYVLCSLLMKTVTGPQHLTRQHLCTVEDMHIFRRYIRGTMGERILAFWLDAERYRRHTKPKHRRFTFREIQYKYIRGGSPLELTELMKWKSMCGGLSGLESKSFTSPKEITKHICEPNYSVFSETVFVPLQTLILDRLRSYWVPKFVVHREKMRSRSKDRWRKSIGMGTPMAMGDLGPDADKLKVMRALDKVTRDLDEVKEEEEAMDQESVDKYMELHKVVSAESVEEPSMEELERQRVERWRDWFWETAEREDGDIEEEEEEQEKQEEGILTVTSYTQSPNHTPQGTPLDIRRTCAERRHASLSSIASSPFPTRSGTSTSKGTRSSSDSALSTPEVIEELTKILAEGGAESGDERHSSDKQSAVISKQSAVVGSPDKTKNIIRKDMEEELNEQRVNLPRMDPFALKAGEKGSRTVFEALHESEDGTQWPLWEMRRSSGELPPLTTLDAIRRASVPRIIQIGTTPTGFDMLYSKPRTAHPSHTLEYQTMLQNVLAQSGDLLAAVASDRLAGGPFSDFLEITDDQEALVRLQFWADSQRYLVPTETLGSYNKYRMAMMLIKTYLAPGSPREFPLTTRARRRLIKLLPVEEGDILLTRVAQVTAQALSLPWSKYVRHEEQQFISFTTISRKKETGTPKDKEERRKEKEEEEKEEETAGRSVNMWRAMELAISLATSGFDDDDDNDVEQCEEKKIPSLKEATKAKEAQQARRGSHFYGHIKKEATEKSEDDEKQAAGKVRPNRPKNFHDCLIEPAQFNWFKRYMTEQSAETALFFWQAVENMKNNCKDGKSRQARANVIVRKYFINIDVPASENLQCKADIIREIPVLEKVTPPMLLSAQTCVIRTMEEAWFRKYIATFPDEEEGENVDKYAMRNTLAGVYKMAAHGKTRGLWAMFASNISNFQDGIHNRTGLEAEFIQFLKKEKQATVEHSPVRNSVIRRHRSTHE